MVSGATVDGWKCASGKPDVLVVGAGPSGLAIAAELARLGLATTVVAPRLGETWERSYGAFRRDLPDTSLDAAVRRTFVRPLVRVSASPPIALSETYVRFDTVALQTLLVERAARSGVQLLSGSIDRVEFEPESQAPVCRASLDPGPGEKQIEPRRVRLPARLVVNASGGALITEGAPRALPVGYQSAYGEWIDVAEHGLADGEMFLMDYRPSGSGSSSQKSFGSFLYAMPETGPAHGPGVLFVQETVLIGEAPAPMSVLRERLGRRLKSMGLHSARTLGTERCVIPLGGALPDPRARLLPFGAASGFVHPATGYQLAKALRLAPEIARVVAEGLESGREDVVSSAIEHMWPEAARRSYRFYELGAATLATLDADMMEEFIGDFFSLSGGRWQRFMSGAMDAAEIAETMWRVFVRARGALRARLIQGGSTATSRVIAQKMN